MKALVGRLLKGFCKIILLILWSLSFSACLTQGTGSEAGTEVVADPSDEPSAPPLTAPAQTVCDPFNVGTTARNRGLIGNLLYLRDDQPRYGRAVDYVDNGEVIPSTLYFDQLYIPTRAFDLGFYTQAGELVTNATNQPIYEYFGLRLESQLALGAAEAPGWYQMAVLSDDGAMLSTKNADGSLTTLVDNDGTHPTRMGCSSRAVYLDRASKIPVVLEYYQGPRYHISLVVMWRPLPAGADPQAPTVDNECGQAGNSRFFDSNMVPSAPQTAFYELLARGWKSLANENYYFPEAASNPCAAEDPLLITSFVITQVTRTSVTVSWLTSLPSTTQAVVKNVGTGSTITSPVDPLPRTSHTVTLTGLSANTLYAVRGLSQTSGGQPAQSNESAFRTAR